MNDPSSFDTATRVAAGDDGTSYDGTAIFLHWTTALLVIIQFLSAFTWDYFRHDTRETMQSLHVSLGMLLTAAIIARVVWRLIPGHQVSSLEAGWVGLASKAVHYLLYGLLLIQAVTGFLFRWAQGHPAEFFGLFGIPGPFGAVEKATRREIHSIHEWIGYSIVIIALGHALAALYHHYALHDRVLGRMFPPARKSEAGSRLRN
jgi:cytochrome b561